MNLPSIQTNIKTLPIKLVIRADSETRKVCPNSMARKR